MKLQEETPTNGHFEQNLESDFNFSYIIFPFCSKCQKNIQKIEIIKAVRTKVTRITGLLIAAKKTKKQKKKREKKKGANKALSTRIQKCRLRLITCYETLLGP